MKITDMVVFYYALVTAALFLLMGLDKWQAVRGKSRIPEMTLFALSVIGGGVGGFLGMRIFHHKVRKIQFYFVFFTTTFIHLYLLWKYLYPIAENI